MGTQVAVGLRSASLHSVLPTSSLPAAAGNFLVGPSLLCAEGGDTLGHLYPHHIDLSDYLNPP